LGLVSLSTFEPVPKKKQTAVGRHGFQHKGAEGRVIWTMLAELGAPNHKALERSLRGQTRQDRKLVKVSGRTFHGVRRWTRGKDFFCSM